MDLKGVLIVAIVAALILFAVIWVVTPRPGERPDQNLPGIEGRFNP